MRDIVIGDSEFAGDWIPFYQEVANRICDFRMDRPAFYERMNAISGDLNASGLFPDEVVFEKRIGRFALYEMLMRDYDEGQMRFVQQTIKKSLDIKESAPKWFPIVKPIEKPIAEIFRLDYHEPFFSFEDWSWGLLSNEEDFAHFFNSWAMNRKCRRILTTWLYLMSPTHYIGIDDWMSDYLMNGCHFWVEHHPESLSVEYPDVIIGLPRYDRYKEWLWHMEEAVSNSRFAGLIHELSYAAYRWAIENLKHEEEGERP